MYDSFNVYSNAKLQSPPRFGRVKQKWGIKTQVQQRGKRLAPPWVIGRSVKRVGLSERASKC